MSRDPDFNPDADSLLPPGNITQTTKHSQQLDANSQMEPTNRDVHGVNAGPGVSIDSGADVGGGGGDQSRDNVGGIERGVILDKSKCVCVMYVRVFVCVHVKLCGIT